MSLVRITDSDGELLQENTVEELVERNVGNVGLCRLLRDLAVGETVDVRLADDSMTVTVERVS